MQCLKLHLKIELSFRDLPLFTARGGSIYMQESLIPKISPPQQFMPPFFHHSPAINNDHSLSPVDESWPKTCKNSELLQ